MLLSEPNSQLMSDSFYHITEFSELDKKEEKKKSSKTFYFGHVGHPYIDVISVLPEDVMKSYLTHVSDKKIRNGYITWETKVMR